MVVKEHPRQNRCNTCPGWQQNYGNFFVTKSFRRAYLTKPTFFQTKCSFYRVNGKRRKLFLIFQFPLRQSNTSADFKILIKSVKVCSACNHPHWIVNTDDGKGGFLFFKTYYFSQLFMPMLFGIVNQRFKGWFCAAISC
jgi:hypothetical protein